ncbi:SEC-C domain-containing protein [Archangium lansingense]|uniref:SEC-C domain-containing protein n=1 Tax=Archangium lansingense TaxID=2995310 RepID=A0ABT4AMD5_9BACT|nr:SEC-C domain-containing protein [Archangium lansinium]MCY1082014.1 SEC-C domain-containing protein [Archangium lansinium]
MPSRNEPCPCGSGQKYKRCCLGEARRSGWSGLLPARRGRPTGVDEVTAEAAVLAEDVLASPNPIQRTREGMILLREMFREDGPLASLRWSWDELVPVVERHIFRVTEEVEDMEERRERLFDRCAPELMDSERVERFDQGLRQALMEPGRTQEERRALAVSVLEMRGVSRLPPYTYWRHQSMAWLMMAQVTEWAARRSRMNAAVGWALGEEPGQGSGPGMSPRAMLRAMEEPERVLAAVRDAAQADPELMELLAKYEQSILRSIIYGETPEVLNGEEWLWMTVVLREPLRLEAPEQAAHVDVEALLAKLDEEVKQAVLTRVEAASRDRSSPPEAQQWFDWAYKVLVVHPLAFYGAFAKAREAPLLERFEGEAGLVHELQRRERWRAEDLEPYRLHLAAREAHGAEQRVRRLQALLRGGVPTPGPVLKA